jgi:CheY-like chemotaxis protein/HPt (histidine-containing phosphotransfer) domain-containing protein
VLIVDDNATNREILGQQLAYLGLRHESAAGAAQALKRLREAAARRDPFDVVLLDWCMPDLDGIGLARRIRDDPACGNLALVLLSSVNLGERAAEADAIGISAWLTKPVRFSQLSACIARSITPEAEAVPPSRPLAAEEAAPPFATGGRVLLAEDHAVNQAVAVQMLEMLGAAVDLVEDGAAALEASARGVYDLVLMDCNMPVMDGFEAAGAIRRRETQAGARRLPIVALTANALQGDRERCLAAGMDDYLSKPFTLAELGTVLGRWMPDSGDALGSSGVARIDASSAAVDGEAEVSTESSEPPLDGGVLKGLRAMDPDGSSAFLRRLVGAYLKNAEADLAQLAAGVTATDAEGLRKGAHRLKSASANLGAMGLATLCRELEAETRAGQLDRAGSMVAAIRVEHARVAAALNEQIGEEVPS